MMRLNPTVSDAKGIRGVQSFKAAPPSSYPVAKDSRTSVGGLDVSDKGQMNVFGKNQQQQTLHPHWCDLETVENS